MTANIWFYDNSMSNMATDDRIHFVKINESSGAELSSSLGTVADVFKTKDNGFTKNTVPQEYTDPKSGIQEKEIMELKRAAMQGKVSAVVFDWDRTLTKIEGLYTPVDKKTESLDQYKKSLAQRYPKFMGGVDEMSDKELAQYVFHNHDDEDVDKRPRMLGEMMRDIQSMGIPIFILTNSEIADISKGGDNRKVLTELLEQIGVTIPVSHVLYNTKKQSFDRSKYVSGKEQIIIENILPMIHDKAREAGTMGGKRTRKHRKNNKKRGTHKKHKKRGTHKKHKKRGTHKKRKTKVNKRR